MYVLLGYVFDALKIQGKQKHTKQRNMIEHSCNINTPLAIGSVLSVKAEVYYYCHSTFCGRKIN